MTSISRPARIVLVTTSAIAVFATTAPAQEPAPQPPIQFTPADVPWPLSLAQARKAARAKAIRAWGAREPRVVRVHRVTYSKVRCRVTWRGATRTRTVTVTRTSADGVRATV